MVDEIVKRFPGISCGYIEKNGTAKYAFLSLIHI